MSAALELQDLSVQFHTGKEIVQAVRGVSLEVQEGEVLAIVGESGCGKSVLCKSVMKLLPQTAYIAGGRILVDGVDITDYREREMEKLRGNVFSMVFQDPMTSLNPTMKIGTQIAEAVRVHEPKIRKAELDGRVLELLGLVGIDRAKERMQQYPGQMSGGMRQRCVLAIALASNPRILFADEPTTALDVTIQAQILELFRNIQKKFRTATILVSHDLSVVAGVADRVAVMYAGKIVEIGTTEEIFYQPKHPYTWALLQSLPALSKGKAELFTIPGMPPNLAHPPKGDAFACRNPYAVARDYEEEPPMFRVSDTHYAATWLLAEDAPKIMFGRENRKKRVIHQEWKDAEVLLDVRHLNHAFSLSRKLAVKAVDDVSFQLRKGEIFGLVGESGSGKSTVARCIMNLYHNGSGEVYYNGIPLHDRKAYRKMRRQIRQNIQIIFQDSTSSLNPRMKVKDIITEPLVINHIRPKRGTYREEAAFQMKYVGLDESFMDKFPGELSGGQRQRVAIARAVIMEPELLIADEPIASLDVSIQAQIVNLFRHLQEEHGFTFLFIAHDLAMVEYLCDRVGVMYHGKLVELAPSEELYSNPVHPYTKTLLSAIPVPDPIRERKRVLQYYDGEGMENSVWTEVSPEHFAMLPADGKVCSI